MVEIMLWTWFRPLRAYVSATGNIRLGAGVLESGVDWFFRESIR